MTINEFKEIANNYIGKIKQIDDCIYIENVNKICDYYQSGEIHKKANVLCKVGVDKNSLFADEKTCEIIGGMFGGRATKDNVLFYLKRYGFIKKEVVQYSFFD